MANNYGDYGQSASYSTNNTYMSYSSSKNEQNSYESDEPEQFRKLFVGNLNYTTTEDTLREYFGQFGQLLDCVVMKEPKTNKYVICMHHRLVVLCWHVVCVEK
jgi:RNA recognition motif-containing protein